MEGADLRFGVQDLGLGVGKWLVVSLAPLSSSCLGMDVQLVQGYCFEV